jgi:hypothetical protein
LRRKSIGAHICVALSPPSDELCALRYINWMLLYAHEVRVERFTNWLGMLPRFRTLTIHGEVLVARFQLPWTGRLHFALKIHLTDNFEN